MNIPNTESSKIAVNGIRLHYLEWKGAGDTLLFLHGFGDQAFIFEQFAARFAGEYQILALTRRGHGESDSPSSGYDPDTLVDDIRAFMDAKEIETAVLVGHSLAGIELTHLATKHPERVSKLIYLDAVYDYSSRVKTGETAELADLMAPNARHEFESFDDFRTYFKVDREDLAEIWNESLDRQYSIELVKAPNGKFTYRDRSAAFGQIHEGALSFIPKPASIKAPTLSFVSYADQRPPWFFTIEQKRRALEWIQTEWLSCKRRELELFRQHIPQAEVIELPDGHHYSFIAQEDLVFAETKRFCERSPAAKN